DVITGARSGGITPPYTHLELLFGRENLRERGEDFLNFIQEQIRKRKVILENLSAGNAREESEKKLKLLQGVLQGDVSGIL
ncbi:MAG: hypothetical protein J6Z36_00345, partial [Clostridia bacterium]|nr:hypothetical protein [Clostridia bacterium]